MAYIRCTKASGGSIPTFDWSIASPLYTQYKKNETATSTFTASESCRVLVYNSEVIDEAGSGHSTQANITTTGTVVKSVIDQTTFDSGTKVRDSETRLSLIDLDANDTVTISNSSRTSYVNKTHIVWDATGITDILDSSYYDAIVDSYRDVTKQYSISTGIYLLIAQEVSGADVECAASVSGGGVLSGYSNIATNNSIAVAVAAGTSIETFTTRDTSNYVSVIYGAWRITGTGQMPNITPSNSSPASISADTPVNPTTNGYAIESYNTKTPSNSSPVALTSGEIDKIGGNGYAIESYSNVTPSDSNPVPLTSGNIAKLNGNGYAITSQPIDTSPTSFPSIMYSGDVLRLTDNGYIVDDMSTLIVGAGDNVHDVIADGKSYYADGNGVAIEGYMSITPSNSIPVSLSSGDYYKPSASGYAISSYSSKTPSDSSPASVSSGAIIKASASGYLYATVQPKVKTGTFTGSTSTTTKVTCGFKPKQICYYYDASTNVKSMIIYDENNSTTKTIGAYKTSSSAYGVSEYTIGGTNQNTIASVDNDGFTVNKVSTNFSSGTWRYFAIG